MKILLTAAERAEIEQSLESIIAVDNGTSKDPDAAVAHAGVVIDKCLGVFLEDTGLDNNGEIADLFRGLLKYAETEPADAYPAH